MQAGPMGSGRRCDRWALAALGALALAGCDGRVHGLLLAPDGDGQGGEPDGGPSFGARPCADVFDPDVLVSVHLELDDDDLAALEADFRYPLEVYEETGDWPLDMPSTYHPVDELRIGDEVITDAKVRLKGSTSWRYALLLDGERAKMQFILSFNETDANGRFQGLRKVELDMPRNDPTMLRQRLGLSFLRDDLGVPAQCASSARVHLNGEYYGLYAALERADKEFLGRNFGTYDDGDLWEGGYHVTVNEDTVDRARRDQLFAATEIDEMVPMTDMDASLLTWAGEAVMPDGDGYYGGGHNYYLYDHPTRGFIWLPHDLDAAFTYVDHDVDPIYWARDTQPARHYRLVMDAPRWLAHYEETLCRTVHAAYDPVALRARVLAWAEQIEAAAAEDPRFRYTPAEWREAIDELADRPAERKAFIEDWCDCRERGGPDRDGDGAPFCRDVADDDPDVHPGAAERCGDDPDAGEPLDDDCDGLIDEGC